MAPPTTLTSNVRNMRAFRDCLPMRAACLFSELSHQCSPRVAGVSSQVQTGCSSVGVLRELGKRGPAGKTKRRNTECFHVTHVTAATAAATAAAVSPSQRLLWCYAPPMAWNQLSVLIAVHFSYPHSHPRVQALAPPYVDIDQQKRPD